MSNKTSKYIKYAIGEVILVVIGILFALKINTWNQSRQDRVQEQEILRQLKVEYVNNLNQLNQKISLREQVIASSFKILDYRLQDANEIAVDSFDKHLARIIIRPTFDAELGVTNELTNSGKLYLLSNAELRNRLASFPSHLNELREEEIVTSNWVEGEIMPFLIKHYQVTNLFQEFLSDEEFRKMYTYTQAETSALVERETEHTTFESLLKNLDLEDYVSLIITYTNYTNEQSEGVKLKIEEIITLVNDEIRD